MEHIPFHDVIRIYTQKSNKKPTVFWDIVFFLVHEV